MTWRVLHGDCRELLAALEPDSLDSCVTDPPYELGFMGRKWDASGIAFDVEMWRLVLRALKPGAHLVAFGGTRTYHRMACAIEDAGFEIRDSLDWQYGSGFPKSLDVSKAIDDALFSRWLEEHPEARAWLRVCDIVRRWVALLPEAEIDPEWSERVDAAESMVRAAYGFERQVVGSRVLQGRAAQSCADKGGTYSAAAPSSAGLSKTIDVTAAATPEAQAWDGWGTALKPGHEPIVLARKPLAGTVAANVLEHGTGALHIDACRLGDGSDKTPAPTSRGDSEPSFTTTDAARLGGDDSIGRWPPNVLFTHSAGCRRVGSRRAKAAAGVRGGSPDGNGVYSGRFPRGDARPVGYAEADGCESVPTYDCAEDCPVRALEGQSGERPTSTHVVKRASGAGYAPNAFGKESRPSGTEMICYGDAGTAARFFPCFEWSPEADDPEHWPPFLYVAKASTSEREAGLEGFSVHSAGAVTGRSDGAAGLRSPRAGAGRSSSGRRNTHPTVKPIELMRWLVRLVTPPGGTVLDPFTGSGSTGCAAVLEHASFVGFDLIDSHVAIARARIAHWEPKQLDLFAVGT